MNEEMKIHTDGGSRGNPGPAAIGMVIDHGGKRKEYACCIGKATNNEAEYSALVLALKKAKQFVGRERAKKINVKCFADSELMVKQLNHEYKLKNEAIKEFFIEIWNLSIDFGSVSFEHVRREHNKRADRLLNQALDGECAKFDF